MELKLYWFNDVLKILIQWNLSLWTDMPEIMTPLKLVGPNGVHRKGVPIPPTEIL